MASYMGDGYEIEWVWKEVVIYWEGNQGLAFDAGWGVEPPGLLVPSPAIWSEVMPEWLRDRRDVVVSRLREHSGHEIEEDVHGHYRLNPQQHSVAR